MCGNQHVPQLLLKQSDTKDTLNICMKTFDAKILIFDKMIALFLNRNFACA